MPPKFDGDATIIERAAAIDSEVREESCLYELLLVDGHPPAVRQSLIHSLRSDDLGFWAKTKDGFRV